MAKPSFKKRAAPVPREVSSLVEQPVAASPAGRVVNYVPGGPTIQAFHDSDAFVRGIMGPFGSSKSSACVMEIIKRANLQNKAPDGIRYTRFAIIRNSYPELKTTTIKTWSDWCPLQYGKITFDSPIIHHIKVGDINCEVLFMALDREDDVKKLLSLELTGAWLNEAREIPKGIRDGVTGRVGRYPKMDMGGATWFGIIMDTNPPDNESWWYREDCEERPEGFVYFSQPSGRSPEAENLANLPKGYYERLCAGKDEDWIKVYVDGQYGYVTEGKPVYPMFRDRVHTSQDILVPSDELALEIGVDFGLTPAAIIAQKLVDGRWQIIDELTTDNCGVQRFAETLTKYVRTHYPHHTVGAVWGDPAGNQRGSNDEKTALDIMKEYTGWPCKAAPTNDLTMRREVVIGALNRMVDGNPGFLLSPKCKVLRKGFTGGYHYKSVRTGNGTQFHDTPAKNSYSHPHDALQYLLLGGGEHDVILNRKRRTDERRQVRVAKDVDYDLFGC